MLSNMEVERGRLIGITTLFCVKESTPKINGLSKGFPDCAIRQYTDVQFKGKKMTINRKSKKVICDFIVKDKSCGRSLAYIKHLPCKATTIDG